PAYSIRLDWSAIRSAPDNDLTACPLRRVRVAGRGSVRGAGGGPTVCGWTVSTASIQPPSIATSAPDDHFTAGPDCSVRASCRGSVGGANGGPSVGNGI